MKRIAVGLFLIALAWAPPVLADYGSAKNAFDRGDYASALAGFRALAEQEDPRGHFALGVMYQKGWGVSQDYREASRWYQMAAERGLPRAQNNLGVLYRRGLGVERNFERALKWFSQAATQGFARAEFNLAEMYRLGQGVPRDLVRAYVWYEFPLTDLPGRGRSTAALRRSAIVDRMSVAELAEAERLARAFRTGREAVASGEARPGTLPQLVVLADILGPQGTGDQPLTR